MSSGKYSSSKSSLGDAIVNINSDPFSPPTSNSGGDLNKRHQSDSSTGSVENKGEGRNRFFSADHIQHRKKGNNLLQMSLMNSPKSPRHSSSLNNSSQHDSVFLEAKKWMAEKIINHSIEDINNISQQLIDTSNVSLTDADIKQLKISFLEGNPLSPKHDVTDESKIVSIQEKLDRIKMDEVDEHETNGHVDAISPMSKPRAHISSPSVTDTKSDDAPKVILERIKYLLEDNNKEEAKKQLSKLSELLSEKPKTLQVQPIVRQDTFDIDPNTGNKKYLSNTHKGDGDSNDILEQIAKLICHHSVDVSSMNLSRGSANGAETKVVLIMPKMTSPVATPVKTNSNPNRRSVSMSLPKKPQTALKAIENKKLSTPLKHLTTSTATSRRSSFTAPRSLSKPSNPYEQKSNMSAVKKSLMPSMEKTPVKQRVRENGKLSPSNRPATTSIRRSVSLKAPVAMPSVKLTVATPTKTRPVTSTPTPSKLSLDSTSSVPSKRLSINPTTSRLAISRLSTTTRLVSTATKPSSGLNGINSRPVSKKTDFKTPYNNSSKKSSEV